MTEFTPQSTDRTRDNTNPLVSNVVFESSVSITLTLSGSWYSGTATVNLPLNTQYAGLVVEAWIRLQAVGGGNPVTYYQIPFSNATSSGVLHDTAYISVASPSKEATYSITFGYGSTQAVLINPTIYYRVKTDRIASSGLSFT